MKKEEQSPQSMVQFFITSSGIVVSSHRVSEKIYKELPRYETFDEKRLYASLLHLLKKSAQEARALYGVVDTLRVDLASPWSHSEIHTLNYARASECMVTKELLASNLRTELARITHIQEKKNIDAHIIEAESLQYRLNGYAVGDPLGQKVRRIETDLLVSFMTKDYYTEISHILVSHFHTTDITFHSMVRGYRNFFNQSETPVATGTIIDYMAETTEVSLMNDKGIYATHVIPVGFYEVIRMIAQQYAVDMHTAHSLVRMYYEGVVQEKDHIQIKRTLTAYRDKYMGMLFRILADTRASSLEYKAPLPLYVVTDDFWGKVITFESTDILYVQDLLTSSVRGDQVSVVEINRNTVYNYWY